MRPQFGANTRERLQQYDEELFKLVDEVYQQSEFRYVRYDHRKPRADNRGTGTSRPAQAQKR